MRSIEWLDIRDNRIEDISVLNNLPNIRKLFLSDNKIRSIVPLSNMYSLRWVLMERNQISDLWPIYNLKKLTDIMSYDNDLNSFERTSINNKAVIEKYKKEGKNIHLEKIVINSIYQLEPSRIIAN